MIPVIALVGRPNVGKSTLFNRLTKSQDALVADFPGLTRDRQYGDVVYQDKPFIVVDTGGIGVDDLAVDELMSKQSSAAIEESDIIFFMVDARDGLTAVDKDIANRVRKSSKQVYLVVNKADGIDEDIALAEFQGLGFEYIYALSASHGRGINDLLSTVTKEFLTVEEEDPFDSTSIKIAFVGRPNVGKSTLINRILGEERVVVYDMPGTTRDSISIPFNRDDQPYVLIDTAGVRKRGRINEKIEKFSIIKSLQAVKASQVCLLVVDAQEGLTEQDLHLLGFVIESGRALVIAINKWDGLTEDHKEHVKAEIDRRLHFVKYAKIRFISALHGTGVGLLFKDINQAYQSSMQSLSTPKLTRMLQSFITKHPPPLVQGRRIKLRYAHAGGQNPPLIIIHGNQLDSIPNNYKRYLINEFTAELNLVGTPLKIEFKGGDNPYKGRKNPLTTRQIHKKKRLIRHIKKGKGK
jgi:GTPase